MLESDPYNFKRFLDAQGPIYDRVLAELIRGRKTSHWMWFIFPQFAGLGRSSTANHYAIHSREEGLAYLGHPVLGTRLRQCAAHVVAIEGQNATAIFGYPDDLKLKSCMTLFATLAPEEGVFMAVLTKYYRSDLDDRTLRLMDDS